jgi:hypothetical protein
VGAVAVIVALASLGLSFSIGSAGPAVGAQPRTNPPCVGVSAAGGPCYADYAFTGSAQQFVVPDGVAAVTIEAYGGFGGSNAFTIAGGENGAVAGTLAVKPGEVLTILVGGAGGSGTMSGGGGAGGFGGGGAGGDGAGGGGGATVVSGPEGQVQLVAGGGGGSATGTIGGSGGELGTPWPPGEPGPPGGLNGGSAEGVIGTCLDVCGAPGLGGTQSGGGGGFSSGSGPATSTSGGSGGAGGDFLPFDVLNGGGGGGGGGGGDFGGGGGGGGGGASETLGGSGGGGGSSFAAADITDVQDTPGDLSVNGSYGGYVYVGYPDPCAAGVASCTPTTTITTPTTTSTTQPSTGCPSASGSQAHAASKPALVWCPVKLDAKYAASAEEAQYEADITQLDEEYMITCMVHDPDTGAMCAVYHISRSIEATQRDKAEALVKDPPNPHFKTVAKPTPVRVRAVAGKRFSAFNSLMQDIARISALEQAIDTAADCETGAHDAGKQRYVALQRTALVGFARRVLTLLPATTKLIAPAGLPFAQLTKGFPTRTASVSFKPLIAANSDLGQAMRKIIANT